MPEPKVETFYTTDYSFYGNGSQKIFYNDENGYWRKICDRFGFLVSTCKKTLKVKENEGGVMPYKFTDPKFIKIFLDLHHNVKLG